MNALHPVVITEQVGWCVVRAAHYIMQPDDFPEGCGIVHDASKGITWGIGKSQFGDTIRVQLGVPLCHGCDKAIPKNGVCDECEMIHADITEKVL